MNRHQHAVIRAAYLGFAFNEYPTDRLHFVSPPCPTDPVNASEMTAIRAYLGAHWPELLPHIAEHLAQQRLACEPFEK